MVNRMKNCIVCGREFESYRGRKTCSDECQQERIKMHWQEANERRKRGENALEQKACAICGKTFEGNANAKYCSGKCADQGRKKERKEYFSELYYKENKNKLIKKVKERRKTKSIFTKK